MSCEIVTNWREKVKITVVILTLTQKAQQHTISNMKLATQLWLVVILSIVAGVVFLLTIRGLHPEWTDLYWVMVSLTCAQGVLALGAAWFFLSSLESFKPNLRKSYILLCIGVVAFGLSQAQLVPVSYLNAQWWVANGFFTVPYMTSFVFMFMGMRQFVKAINFKTRWISTPLASMTSIGIALVLAAVPHPPSQLSDGQYTTVVIFTSIVSIFFFFAAGAAFSLRREIGQLYVKGLTWLATGLIVGVLGGLHYVFVEMFVRVDWYYAGNLTVVPMFIASALILYGGYSLREISEIASNYKPNRISPDPLVLIEVVTYASGLVSRPSDLDITLDDLRGVTAQLNSTKSGLSERQQQIVVSVYKRVEDYLVQAEHLRIYRRNRLRADIIAKFKLNTAEKQLLWGDEYLDRVSVK